MRGIVLALVLVLLSLPVAAVTPAEILDDPVLEARARELSKDLRCLVCRNENIDESHAELAQDLRVLVRERLVLGDSDEEVIDHIVDRYGEYVLLRPTATGANLILWIAGPAMLAMAVGIGAGFVLRRRRAAAPSEVALNSEEQARLRELLGE